jgi:hypothetical protein
VALIADILLIAGALAAAFYCLILSRRLSRFGSLENGMGGAITTLSAQVSDMTGTLNRAQAAAKVSSETLEEATLRAEAAATRLELLLASLHDLPTAAPAPSVAPMPRQEPPKAPPRETNGPTFLRSPRPNGQGRVAR